MAEQPANKIANAVKSCVAYAADSDRPFHQIADFLLMLKSSGFSNEELVEVEVKVLTEMGKWHLDDSGDT